MDKTTIDEVIYHLKQSLLNNGIHVDSIALFGSALNGNMDKDSDIDLIIISSDFENLDSFERAKLTMNPEIDTLKKFKISMDIINLTPTEYMKSNMKLCYYVFKSERLIFSPFQQYHIFNMMGMRKHIHRLNAGNFVEFIH